MSEDPVILIWFIATIWFSATLIPYLENAHGRDLTWFGTLLFLPCVIIHTAYRHIVTLVDLAVKHSPPVFNDEE